MSSRVCEHDIELVGGFCSKCIEVMCSKAVPGPSELEMHRLAYRMCKDAGFDGPEELLSAYNCSEKKLAELTVQIEEMRRDMQTLWNLGAKLLLEKP